jgi:hypothetical protein
MHKIRVQYCINTIRLGVVQIVCLVDSESEIMTESEYSGCQCSEPTQFYMYYNV